MKGKTKFYSKRCITFSKLLFFQMLSLTGFFFLFGCSANQDNKANSSSLNNLNEFQYDLILRRQWMKLEEIRDSIGSIVNLDSLYQNRIYTNGLPYHIYVPENLKKDQSYPLIIFLHGYSDLSLDTHGGFPKGIWSLPQIQSKYPHILFIPRYRTFDDMWVQDNYRIMVIETINDLISEFNSNTKKPNIDKSRIYLTGFSQGGMGTWDYIRHYPNKFAAACPLAGFFHGPQNISEAQVIKHIPIWIFNGEDDDGVDGSRLSYLVLKKVQAPNVTYHEYKNHGHVIDDFAYFTEGFMDWLFDQKINE